MRPLPQILIWAGAEGAIQFQPGGNARVCIRNLLQSRAWAAQNLCPWSALAGLDLYFATVHTEERSAGVACAASLRLFSTE